MSITAMADQLEAADQLRRDDRRRGKPWRWPWMPLPDEDDSVRRSQVIALALGLLATPVSIALIAWWLVAVLSSQ